MFGNFIFNISSLIKKHVYLTVFIVFFIIVNFLLILLVLLTKKEVTLQHPSPTPTGTEQNKPTGFFKILPTPLISSSVNLAEGTDFIFNFKDPVLPNEENIYIVGSYEITRNYAEQIARNFSFNGLPRELKDAQNETSLIWDNTNKSLLISLEFGYIEYLDSGTDQSSQTITAGQEAISLAKEFLISKGLYFPDLETSGDRVIFYNESGGLDLAEVGEFSQANLFEVKFIRKLKDKVVYAQQANDSQISVFINNYRHLRKISLQYPLVQPDSKKYPLITIEEAKQKIKNREGKLVRIIGDDTFETSSISGSIILNSVELVYFDDKKSRSIQPILLFKGVANQKGIVVYLPAIKS